MSWPPQKFGMVPINISIIVIIITTIIRRFKKKKENKALTEAPTDKSTVFQARQTTFQTTMITMIIVKAGLRTLHEAGPELQRTISTDLEVVLYFILNRAVVILFIIAIIRDAKSGRYGRISQK